MFVTWKLLELRARHADLFRDGTYEPIDAGPNVVAFIRRHEDDAVVVAVPRLIANLVKPGTLPIGDVWGDATLPVAGTWRNLFTGENTRRRNRPEPSLRRFLPPCWRRRRIQAWRPRRRRR